MADSTQNFSEEIIYSEAIKQVMQDNVGFAPLKFIYKNITKYRKKHVKLQITRFRKEFKERGLCFN